VVCTVFAVLRAVDAQLAVSGAFRDFSHSADLTDWKRPGPYIMLASTFGFGAAAAGLFVFQFSSLYRSVLWAASAIVWLVLLAMAHSLALYLPILILQTKVGPLTVSRIFEAILLIILASSALWLIKDAQGSEATPRKA
jgi:hypothetical protein